VGRATVFRTIDLLADMRILHRLHGEGCHAYTACTPGHHHHLVCSTCGRVETVDVCGLEEMMRTLSQATNFAIEEHHLEFSGRCADCRTG
jgi:Fur family ferric uptake transcriptional regulator